MTRLEKLRAKLPTEVDGLLLTSDISRFYLCGFDYSDGYIIVTPTKAIVLADSRYIEAAKAAIGDEFDVEKFSGVRKQYLGEYFEKLNIKKLLFEDRVLSVYDFEALKSEFPDIDFKPAGGIIALLREFKDETEVENIKKAQSIAEAAFEHILGYISPDRTEIDVALELEFFMRSHGARRTSFNTIAVSGSASSLPHGVPRNVKLQKGFLTMDYGALYNGYCSDMTRTVVIGKADDEMKKVYNTVLRAQLAAIDAIKEGEKCVEIDAVARNIIAEAGYGECFGHGLGHGVGLEIHEAPRLSTRSASILTKGHIVTVEPGIYIEGKYGVRIEDMVYIGENGPENLTHAPKEMIEL